MLLFPKKTENMTLKELAAHQLKRASDIDKRISSYLSSNADINELDIARLHKYQGLVLKVSSRLGQLKNQVNRLVATPSGAAGTFKITERRYREGLLKFTPHFEQISKALDAIDIKAEVSRRELRHLEEEAANDSSVVSGATLMGLDSHRVKENEVLSDFEQLEETMKNEGKDANLLSGIETSLEQTSDLTADFEENPAHSQSGTSVVDENRMDAPSTENVTQALAFIHDNADFLKAQLRNNDKQKKSKSLVAFSDGLTRVLFPLAVPRITREIVTSYLNSKENDDQSTLHSQYKPLCNYIDALYEPSAARTLLENNPTLEANKG